MRKTDVIYILLCASLLIDTFNGYAIREHAISLSPLYKASILAACLLHIRHPLHFAAISGAFAIFLFVHGLSGSLQDLSKTLDWMFKFLYIYVLFLFMKSDTRIGRLDRIYWVFSSAFVIISLNMLLGHFGFGYPQYTMEGEPIGTRGFFYAGNEISAALVCSAGALMASASVHGTTTRYVLLSVAAIVVASLTTMKTSILALCLLFVLFPLLNPNARPALHTISTKKSIVLGSAPIILGISVYLVFMDSDMLARLSYFYDRNGLVSLIFSQRNVWAQDALRIHSDYGFAELLFGDGLNWVTLMPHGGVVEIDPVDVLMTYGFIGLILVYSLFVFALARSTFFHRHRLSTHYSALILLLIMISSTAGHVVFSGIAGHLVAAVLALSAYRPAHTVTANSIPNSHA